MKCYILNLPNVLFLIGFMSVNHETLASEVDRVERTGDQLQIAIPVLALGLSMFFEEDRSTTSRYIIQNSDGNDFSIKQFSDGTKQLTFSMIAAQTITHSLKYVTQKERPNGKCCTSFPSGHTSAAFTGAAFMHKRYGWKSSILPYLGATYVAYSRVEADKHYVRDVVAGAAIGILSSYYFTKPYENDLKRFRIYPWVEGQYKGFGFSKAF